MKEKAAEGLLSHAVKPEPKNAWRGPEAGSDLLIRFSGAAGACESRSGPASGAGDCRAHSLPGGLARYSAKRTTGALVGRRLPMSLGRDKSRNSLPHNAYRARSGQILCRLLKRD